MKIKSIKAHALSVPLKYVYAVATEPFTVATQIIVEITTDNGLTGLGTIHGPGEGSGRLRPSVKGSLA